MQKTLCCVLCSLHKNVDKIVWFGGTASPFYDAPRAFFSEKTKGEPLRTQRAGEGTFAMFCGDVFSFAVAKRPVK